MPSKIRVMTQLPVMLSPMQPLAVSETPLSMKWSMNCDVPGTTAAKFAGELVFYRPDSSKTAGPFLFNFTRFNCIFAG